MPPSTAKKIKTVFLSSTSKDLQPYRDSVYKAVSGLDGFKCVAMEDFGARDASRWTVAEFCRDAVKQCDVLVGILGINYGTIAEDSDQSYTELEYATAVESNLSRLLYLAPESFPVPAHLIENDELRARQKAFRAHAVNAEGERRAIYDTFNSPDDLARRVLAGITNILINATAEGFEVLRESMQVPEVLQASLVWRTKFQFVRQQLDILKQYKDIHDLLHQLQFGCVVQLGVAMREFPGETALLEAQQLTLQKIADTLVDLSTDADVLRAEQSWIAEVGQMPGQIATAIETRSDEPLRRLTRSLSRVLTRSPSRINTLMVQAARTLLLGELVSAMHVLTNRCRQSRVSAEKIQQLEGGTDALAQLSERLTTHTTQHDLWQQLEDEVRRIENGASDPRELVESWPALLEIQARLTGPADALAPSSSRIRAALEAQPQMVDDAMKEFKSYRRTVATVFEKVDRDLQGLCKELRRIGDQLSPILEMMQ